MIKICPWIKTEMTKMYKATKIKNNFHLVTLINDKSPPMTYFAATEKNSPFSWENPSLKMKISPLCSEKSFFHSVLFF